MILFCMNCSISSADLCIWTIWSVICWKPFSTSASVAATPPVSRILSSCIIFSKSWTDIPICWDANFFSANVISSIACPLSRKASRILYKNSSWFSFANCIISIASKCMPKTVVRFPKLSAALSKFINLSTIPPKPWYDNPNWFRAPAIRAASATWTFPNLSTSVMTSATVPAISWYETPVWSATAFECADTSSKIFVDASPVRDIWRSKSSATFRLDIWNPFSIIDIFWESSLLIWLNLRVCRWASSSLISI